MITIAGDGAQGHRDGPGKHAQFDYPRGLALDVAGNLYVCESHSFRKISVQGIFIDHHHQESLNSNNFHVSHFSYFSFFVFSFMFVYHDMNPSKLY